MGKRDYRHRETKKTKKDTTKLSVVPIVMAPSIVEVVKKKKKKKKEEDEE